MRLRKKGGAYPEKEGKDRQGGESESERRGWTEHDWKMCFLSHLLPRFARKHKTTGKSQNNGINHSKKKKKKEEKKKGKK